MVLNPAPKRVSESAKMTYLDSIVHLHINYNLILAQKTAFLIALAALILTISVGAMFHQQFANFPLLVKLAIVLIALGNAFGVLLLFSAENFKPSRIVRSFHPLSLEDFRDESKDKFARDLRKITDSEDAMIKDYSNQILAMKQDMFEKTRIIKLSRKFIVSPLIIATILAGIQLVLLMF